MFKSEDPILDFDSLEKKVKEAMESSSKEDEDEMTEEQEKLAKFVDGAVSEAMALGRAEADHRQVGGDNTKQLILMMMALQGLTLIASGYLFLTKMGVI